MEWMGNIITSNSGMIFTLLLTLCLTFFSKMIISIFRMGVMFKSDLATKAELEAFKKEVRADMRAYKTELTEAVMSTCVKIIEERLKDITEVRNMATSMKATEARVSEQSKFISEKMADLNSVLDTVRRLNIRVENLSASNGNNNPVRRREA